MKFMNDSWVRETSSMFNFPSSQHSSSPALLGPIPGQCFMGLLAPVSTEY